MLGDTAHSILRRVVSPTSADLTQTAANAILGMGFSEADQDRLQELATKNTEDALSDEERREYEGYVIIGELLALMQAKARQSLKNHPSAA
jgi:hypothetical protein